MKLHIRMIYMKPLAYPVKSSCKVRRIGSSEDHENVFGLLAKLLRMLLKELIPYAEILTSVILVMKLVTFFIQGIDNGIRIFGTAPYVLKVYDTLCILCYHLHIFGCRIEDIVYEYIRPYLVKHTLEVLLVLYPDDVKV